MKFFKTIRKGFTLPEMLLSVTLLGIIGGMVIPAYRTFTIRDELDIAVTTLVQNVRRAQSLSQAGDGDMTWGVRVGVGSILVFKGASYVLRDSSFDENTSIPTSIVPTGMNEVVFSKVIGIPSITGTFTLTSQANESRSVTINAKGMVDY